jgi:hypothetical protein
MAADLGGANLDTLDVYVDVGHDDVGHVRQYVADAVGEVVRDLGEVRAELDDHEEADDDAVVSRCHLDSAAKLLGGKELSDAISQ